jgi:hypothetical protein
VTPRQVPRRWLAAVPALDRLAKSLGTTGYKFASAGELPALTFTGAGRAADRAARWAAVRRAGAAVTEALGDPGLNVIIEYDDGGRAMSEWDTRSAKRVAWAGVGGALVPDPSDYEVELATDTLATTPPAPSPAPLAHQRTARTLAGLVVDCVGGGSDTPIGVPDLGAAHSGALLRTTMKRRRQPDRLGPPPQRRDFLAYDRVRRRFERIAAAAAEVADRSRLTVWDWSGGVRGVGSGARRLHRLSSAAQVMAAGSPRRPRQARSQDLAGRSRRPIALTIHAGNEVWTYDGRSSPPGARRPRIPTSAR